MCVHACYLLVHVCMFHLFALRSVSSEPVVGVEVTPTTARALEDTPPHNTFTLNCAATSRLDGGMEVGVAKLVTWQRAVGAGGSFETLTDGSPEIGISNSDLSQATVMSGLMVTGSMAGSYTYRCVVQLDLTFDPISGSADAAVAIDGGWCVKRVCLCVSWKSNGSVWTRLEIVCDCCQGSRVTRTPFTWCLSQGYHKGCSTAGYSCLGPL